MPLAAKRAHLARAHIELGKFEEAKSSIGRAVKALETTGERWCEAEVHRAAGEIALLSPAPDGAKAEACFMRALAVARQQQAKSWELRAAMSVARLWRGQGKWPSCAIAYWGIALDFLGNSLATTPTRAEAEAGWAALEKAHAVGAKTQRERDWIETLSASARSLSTPSRHLWRQFMHQLRPFVLDQLSHIVGDL